MRLALLVLIVWLVAAVVCNAQQTFVLTPSSRQLNLYQYTGENIAVRVEWAAVEPADGEFNWSYVDEALGIAAGTGHKISIAVMTGQSPQWLYNEGCQKFSDFPCPWDPIFLTKWRVLVHHLARRYDGNPSVAYITVGGLGFSEEGYLTTPKMPTSSAYDGEAWVNAGETIINMYANKFLTTPVYLAFGTHPVPGAKGDMEKVVEYAKARGLGLKVNSLSAVGPNDWQWQEIETSPIPPCFQLVSPLVPIPQALDRARSVGGEFVEVYR